MIKEQRVNIKQIAREAGVSAQTVSRVINDRPDVAPDTRKRIKEIIERLDYQPNHIARSLLKGRSCSIGVITFGLKFFGPSRTFVGIESQANDVGYSLFLRLLYKPESNKVEELFKDMLAHRVDGIIWAVPEIGNNRDWIAREHHRFSVPLVLLSMQPRPGLSVIAVDNSSGGYKATRHLLEQGYENVGIITGPSLWWEAKQRLHGWRVANEEAGRSVDESLIVEGDWTPIGGERGLYRLLEQRPDIEAVFVCNDQMAIGAMEAARKVGRNIPDDLGIVGFDDISESSYFVPPLTTVRQDIGELGRRAVQELNQLIMDRQKGKSNDAISILLQPQLILRESSRRRKALSEFKSISNDGT